MFATKKTDAIYRASINNVIERLRDSVDHRWGCKDADFLWDQYLAMKDSTDVRIALAKAGRYLLVTDASKGIDKRPTRIAKIVDRYWELAQRRGVYDTKPDYLKEVAAMVAESWSKIADLSAVYTHEEMTGDDLVSCYEDIHSCMAGHNAVAMYAENPDVVKVIGVRAIESSGRWEARALIWTLPDGQRYLDRVYPSDGCLAGVYIRQIADNEGWAYRLTDSPDDDSSAGLDMSQAEVVVKDVGHYPYMDTFIWCKQVGGGQLKLRIKQPAGYDWHTMQNEDDRPPWEDENANCCSYCDEREIDGSWVDDGWVCEYCLNNNFCYSEYLDQYIHSDSAVYIDRRDDYVYIDDATYCEHSDEYILTEDAVELHDGNCAHSDDVVMCEDDKEYHVLEDSDLVEVDGLYYTKDSDLITHSLEMGQYELIT